MPQEVGVALEGWLKTLQFSKTLLHLNGNFNNDYRLPPERLHGRRVLRNHEYRKEDLRKEVANNTYKARRTGHFGDS